MKNNHFLASICIPSYNRPEKLKRLLESIDCTQGCNIEIVICEDKSARRQEIRSVVRGYQQNNKSDFLSYFENAKNLGYDGNIRELITKSQGEYIIFMGDDDMFVPNELDLYLEFINSNRDLGYILRSYRNIKADGFEEKFIYYPEVEKFSPGFDAYTTMYRKSVFISGVTIKRELALKYSTNRFDGTLLYQLYIVAEVCLNNKSAAYNRPITQGIIEEKDFYFGMSDAEKEFREPGKITIKGELKFIQSFIKIAEFIDEKYQINSKKEILSDMSKYSYPMIATIRNQGLPVFMSYVIELYKMGLGRTIYFYIYSLGLIFMGERRCTGIIQIIKKIVGKTPSL